MYSDLFCKVYNEFGWNFYPEIFGEQLLKWIHATRAHVRSSLDLACGTGILSEIMAQNGIEAWGMDFSEGMIRIARERCPEIPFHVADMITYHPGRKFDLVTCTGDALNHIHDIRNVERIFRNVYDYLNEGGWFIFDLLKEQEISQEDPFELEYSESLKARLQMTRPTPERVNLQICVYEDGQFRFEENITEAIHPPERVLELLRSCGFRHVSCGDTLLREEGSHGTTWFVVAEK